MPGHLVKFNSDFVNQRWFLPIYNSTTLIKQLVSANDVGIYYKEIKYFRDNNAYAVIFMFNKFIILPDLMLLQVTNN